MDQSVNLALIAAVVSVLGFATTIITALIALSAANAANQAKAVSISNSAQIDRVEKNTNSITAQLVAATGKASYSQGHDAARAEGETKAANLVANPIAPVPVTVVIASTQEPLPVDVKSLPETPGTSSGSV